MNNLWIQIKSWFKPKPKKSRQIKTKIKPVLPIKPFQAKHYRKLIKKLTKQARLIQKNRQQRRETC